VKEREKHFKEIESRKEWKSIRQSWGEGGRKDNRIARRREEKSVMAAKDSGKGGEN
jgi:hypothetical protein